MSYSDFRIHWFDNLSSDIKRELFCTPNYDLRSELEALCEEEFNKQDYHENCS